MADQEHERLCSSEEYDRDPLSRRCQFPNLQMGVRARPSRHYGPTRGGA